MFLALDIGGTSIKAGVFDRDINLLKKYKIEYIDKVKSVHFPALLTSYILEIFSLAKKDYDEINSIGCGVPGIVDEYGNILVVPNLTGIANYPIKDIIREKTNLSIAIDNDANAAALAELYIGNGKMYKNFIYITLGTGIGGAIIYNKQIFRGSIGGAGEIGYTFIDSEIAMEGSSYRVGNLEDYTGRQGIINLANSLKKEYPDSKLNTLQNIDVRDISILANEGDEASQKVLEITGYKLGIALTNIANLLDIPNFIIGGGVSQSKILLNTIENTLKNKTLPSIRDRINLLPAYYQADTGIYGAAILAKINFESN